MDEIDMARLRYDDGGEPAPNTIILGPPIPFQLLCRVFTSFVSSFEFLVQLVRNQWAFLSTSIKRAFLLSVKPMGLQFIIIIHFYMSTAWASLFNFCGCRPWRGSDIDIPLRFSNAIVGLENCFLACFNGSVRRRRSTKANREGQCGTGAGLEIEMMPIACIIFIKQPQQQLLHPNQRIHCTL